MTSIQPVSFKNQQNFNPNEYMVVRRPNAQEMKQARKQRMIRTIAGDAVMAGMFTGFQAIVSKGKAAPKALGKYFAQTFALFVAISGAMNLLFRRN